MDSDMRTAGGGAPCNTADGVNGRPASTTQQKAVHRHAAATLRLGAALDDSPKGVTAIAALALEAESADGAKNQPTQFDRAQWQPAPRGHKEEREHANRRQLVQRLREGRVAAGDVHAAGGSSSHAAVGAVIRGRGSSPGAAGNPAPQGIGDSTSDTTVQIRGPPLGLGAWRVNAALSERAEGVARRRPLPWPGEAPMSATERIAAIRRRLCARAAANVEHADIPAAEVTAGGDDKLRIKSNEDSNMHLSSWVEEESNCASSSVTDGVSDARAHAAAVSAWHGRERRSEAGEVTRPEA